MATSLAWLCSAVVFASDFNKQFVGSIIHSPSSIHCIIFLDKKLYCILCPSTQVYYLCTIANPRLIFFCCGREVALIEWF